LVAFYFLIYIDFLIPSFLISTFFTGIGEYPLQEIFLTSFFFWTFFAGLFFRLLTTIYCLITLLAFLGFKAFFLESSDALT
jgi:hypothetical protein